MFIGHGVSVVLCAFWALTVVPMLRGV